MEDVKHTKRCLSAEFSSLEGGLTLREMRVLLASMAQLHAVGLAWRLAKINTSIANKKGDKDGDAMAMMAAQGGHRDRVGDVVRQCVCAAEEAGTTKKGKSKKGSSKFKVQCRCQRGRTDATLVEYTRLLRVHWATQRRNREKE